MSLGHLGRGCVWGTRLVKILLCSPRGLGWAGLGGVAKEPGDRAEEPEDRQRAQLSWCMVLKSKRVKRAE